MMIRSLNQSRLRLVCVRVWVGSYDERGWELFPFARAAPLGHTAREQNRLRGLRTRMNLLEEG